MQPTTAPSIVLTEKVIQQIRENSAESELLGQLHPRILELIYEQRWFHLFVPRDFGGLGLDLIEALRLEEALAWADGSLGWTVTLCSGASWFIGFLPQEISTSILKDPMACLAGSGSIGGIARQTEFGYEVSGQWNYATGAPHATVFTANCRIEKGSASLNSDNEEAPVVKPFWFWRHEVSLSNNWKTIGMVGTASKGFFIKHLFVPKESCFEIDPQKAVLPQLVFRFPFLQFAEATLAVNIAGMAKHFLDCCEDLITQRKGKTPISGILNEESNQSQLLLEKQRTLFYRTIEEAWNQLAIDGEIGSTVLQQVSEVSINLAIQSREIVDRVYPYCGLYAANPETEINRVWRDLHTASQHSLLVRNIEK